VVQSALFAKRQKMDDPVKRAELHVCVLYCIVYGRFSFFMISMKNMGFVFSCPYRTFRLEIDI
jgi:hypothetical protein